MRPAGARPARAGGRERRHLLIVVLAGLVHVGLVLYAAVGVRGTDQYWYLADVESLAEGRGVATNNLYPVSAIDGPPDLPRPFVHNKPPLYMALPLAWLLGPYAGWLATNLLCNLLAAALLAWIVRERAGRPAGTLAATAYLLAPLTIWLGAQVLVGSILAFLVTLALRLFTLPERTLRHWVLLALLCGVLAISRRNLAPLVLAVPLAHLLADRPARGPALARAALLAGLGLAVMALGALLLEGNTAVSIWARLPTGATGPTANMRQFFELDPRPFALADLLRGGFRGLERQFFATDVANPLFFLPFNALLVLIGLELYTGRLRLRERLVMASLVLVGLHLLTAMLFQVQFRYLAVAFPAVLATAVLPLSESLGRGRPGRWPRRLAILLLVVVTLAADAAMMRAFRAKGLREREARGQVREFLAQRVPPDEAVMVVVGAVPYDLMCGYLLRPRTVLFLAAGYTTEQYLTLQRNVGARWVLGVQDSPVLGQLRSLEPRPVGRLSTALGPFELHHLERTAR